MLRRPFRWKHVLVAVLCGSVVVGCTPQRGERVVIYETFGAGVVRTEDGFALLVGPCISEPIRTVEMYSATGTDPNNTRLLMTVTFDPPVPSSGTAIELSSAGPPGGQVWDVIDPEFIERFNSDTTYMVDDSDPEALFLVVVEASGRESPAGTATDERFDLVVGEVAYLDGVKSPVSAFVCGNGRPVWRYGTAVVGSSG